MIGPRFHGRSLHSWVKLRNRFHATLDFPLLTFPVVRFGDPPLVEPDLPFEHGLLLDIR